VEIFTPNVTEIWDQILTVVLWRLPNRNRRPHFLSEPRRTETEVFLEPCEWF